PAPCQPSSDKHQTQHDGPDDPGGGLRGTDWLFDLFWQQVRMGDLPATLPAAAALFAPAGGVMRGLAAGAKDGLNLWVQRLVAHDARRGASRILRSECDDLYAQSRSTVVVEQFIHDNRALTVKGARPRSIGPRRSGSGPDITQLVKISLGPHGNGLF